MLNFIVVELTIISRHYPNQQSFPIRLHLFPGTAMGTICAPPYAFIFMHKIESQILNYAPHSIHFWRRFIDNCLFTHGEAKLHEPLTFINAIHPTIMFTIKYSKTSIDLLDTSIHIGQGGKLF